MDRNFAGCWSRCRGDRVTKKDGGVEDVAAVRFEVVSEFQPAGDQPAAIAALAKGINRGDRFQTLLGITGSGKSATMAWTIEAVQRPTLILAPNKSLAAQLAQEMKEFFPKNRVEYFVSYYDYYQPEAYIPSSDTFIEKDSAINDEIDRLRHSATAALLTRRDTIVVASVSCIYGMGDPDEYRGNLLELHVGVDYDQRSILKRLVDLQYDRNDLTLGRGNFRVRGDTIEVHPAYDETVTRFEMFGDTVERITIVDPVTGETLQDLNQTMVFPATHYVVMVMDESHVSIPQLHGQYAGDQNRKATLIEHGFRLPSAADNRPLRFEETMERINQCVFLSATPAPFELGLSSQVVEQIVRPTGLIDPEVIVRPTKGQIDDIIEMVNGRVANGDRVLITTLTKKMAEDLSEYLIEQGLKVRYLHSNIDTVQRIEILRALRLGEFDVLVGINLLREGLDLPEVSLVAILDADKAGFLRSQTSLIQMIGRAARNVNGQVVMYADNRTAAMDKAIGETSRRREKQIAYNLEHGIDPQTIRKAVGDILSILRPNEANKVPKLGDRKNMERDKVLNELKSLPQQELEALILTLEEEMALAASEMRFEYAARLRDEVKELKRELRDAK
ncbi:excinuclease ABC subunit UvrB [bacterium]|nr:excinuclease ABC subunit UvrB [bacterium]